MTTTPGNRITSSSLNGLPLHPALANDGKTDADSLERDPESDGRGNSRHQIYAVRVTDQNGDMWMVPYSTILAANGGKIKNGTFRFRFIDSEGVLQEVRLKAKPDKLTEFIGTIDRLALGRREYLIAGEILEAVAVSAVEG